MFLRVGPATSASDQARAAMRKLVQALPATFRADAEAAATATVIDQSRWGEQPRRRPPLVDRLEDAVVTCRRIRMTYTSGSRQRSERIVDPWGLVAKDDSWYLVAGTDRGQRTFRVDRIEQAVTTDEEASPRPAGFALDAAWEAVVGVVELKRARTQATIRIETRYVPVLRQRFGRQCEVIDGDETVEEADGWTRARVAAPTPLDLARDLAGWGGLVQVLDQPAVKDLLLQIATELTGLYQGEA
ncbi:helix-turn-helix transcriptional regulator [Mycolicibacterium stellerae]|uniref:helix-turn-helix transcriptional regulator n=1 Tax=Mycolicibacterium stellerae TaxID=2358193 RepID=UPI001F347BEE|nr:WYL domain-containing protein [Mycolicibacterium stellerae]